MLLDAIKILLMANLIGWPNNHWLLQCGHEVKSDGKNGEIWMTSTINQPKPFDSFVHMFWVWPRFRWVDKKAPRSLLLFILVRQTLLNMYMRLTSCFIFLANVPLDIYLIQVELYPVVVFQSSMLQRASWSFQWIVHWRYLREDLYIISEK